MKFTRVPIEYDAYFKVKLALITAVRRRVMCKWLVVLVVIYKMSWVFRKRRVTQRLLLAFTRRFETYAL